MNNYELTRRFGNKVRGKFVLPDGQLVDERVLQDQFLDSSDFHPFPKVGFENHHQKSAVIRLTKAEAVVWSSMNFFETQSEPRSNCKTNFNSFAGIQIRRTSKRVQNTSFRSAVFRYEKTKTENPEILRLKAQARAKREVYCDAARKYQLLVENPKAKVKTKDGVQFIERRDNKGCFRGRVVLN